MEITSRIETRKDVRAISVRLTGDYTSLDYKGAWDKLMEYCRANAIDCNCPDGEYINIYHDDPAKTPAAECRTDVCIASSMIDGLKPAGDVNIITVYGGRYIVFRYQGPYERLGEVNAKVYGELLPASGEKMRVCDGVIERFQMFERYLNDPEMTAPADLLTEIWIPVE